MKSLVSLHSIRPLFLQNWKSGLTVALISIPLSIALSISSGAGPIPGIITGIWATLIASLFGSSNYNIIGAAGALTTVLFAATLAAPMGLGGLVLPFLAIATGLIMLCVWVLGADRFLYYIPSSVMYGFSAGVAFQIAASEIFDATGLSLLKRTGTFLGDVELYINHAHESRLTAFVVFALFFAGILVWKRFVPKFPAVIPAAVAGIIFGFIDTQFLSLNIMSLGERFGSFTAALAQPISLTTALSFLKTPSALLWLFKTASVIALIALLETLITAKIASKITKTQFSSRKELLGLALANLGSGVMGGLPATGVFIRTGANVKAGATHRMSATIAAVATGIIAVAVLPFFTLVPMPVIAAMLANTALGLIEIDKFKEFWKHEKESFMIAIAVAALTVLHDAAIGVTIGAGLALLLFVNRISHGRFDAVLSFTDADVVHLRGEKVLHIPEKGHIAVVTYSIAGSLGYIDSARHAANLRHLARARNVDAVIIRLRNLFNLDFEGQEMLLEAVEELQEHGKKVCLSSANPSISERLSNMPELRKHIEHGSFFEKTEDALQYLKSA